MASLSLATVTEVASASVPSVPFAVKLTSPDAVWIVTLKTQSQHVPFVQAVAAFVPPDAIAPELTRIASANSITPATQGHVARSNSVLIGVVEPLPDDADVPAASSSVNLDAAISRKSSSSMHFDAAGGGSDTKLVGDGAPAPPHALPEPRQSVTIECSPRLTTEQLLSNVASKIGLPITSFRVEHSTKTRVFCAVDLGDACFVLKAQGLSEYCVTPSRRMVDLVFVQDCLREDQSIVFTLERYVAFDADAIPRVRTLAQTIFGLAASMIDDCCAHGGAVLGHS